MDSNHAVVSREDVSGIGVEDAGDILGIGRITACGVAINLFPDRI
jgi:hypothetical protein